MRRPGIAVPAAAEIPAPWASVLVPHDAPVPTGGPEVFAPLAVVLPDVDGCESHLHVISSGMPPLADWFAYNWTPGSSWWLRDGTGNWHVAAAGEPCRSGTACRRSGCGRRT